MISLFKWETMEHLLDHELETAGAPLLFRIEFLFLSLSSTDFCTFNGFLLLLLLLLLPLLLLFLPSSSFENTD